MLRDYLLHPYHIVPCGELICTLMESPDKGISHGSVKSAAVVIEVFIRIIGICDAGVEVCVVPLFEFRFQGRVEFSPHTSSSRRSIKIDCGLYRPRISPPCLEGRGIGIADNLIPIDSGKIRILTPLSPLCAF